MDHDDLVSEDNGKNLIEQNKVISLFQFIQELNKLKQKSILDYKEYPWFLALSNLPKDPDNICVYYRDSVDEEADSIKKNNENVLLSVRKPAFQKCPEPDKSFIDWLFPEWDNFHKEASVREFIGFDAENKIINKEECSMLDEKKTEESSVFEYFKDNM